jgi:hypothetical protein
MDEDLIPQFKFGKAVPYQAPAPSVKPANHPVPPSTSTSASASVSVPFAPGRVPFSIGNNRQQEPQLPAEVLNTQDVRSGESFVGDSGRKSLMTEGGKGIVVEARVINIDERDREDEVSNC